MSKYQISSFNVLKNTINQRDKEHDDLVSLIKSFEGKQTTKGQRDQITGAYLSLFNLETKIKRNLNDHYYKILKMKDGNKETSKFKTYDAFLKNNKLVKYTTGQKKYTAKKQSDLLSGKTYEFPKPTTPVMSPDDRDAQKKAKDKEESKEDDKDATTPEELAKRKETLRLYYGEDGMTETEKMTIQSMTPQQVESEIARIEKERGIGTTKQEVEVDAGSGTTIRSANQDKVDAEVAKLKRGGGVAYNLGLVDYLAKTDRKTYLKMVDIAEKEYNNFTKDAKLSGSDRNILMAQLFNKALAFNVDEGAYNAFLANYQKTRDQAELDVKAKTEQAEKDKMDAEFNRKQKIQHAKMDELIKNFTAEQEEALDKYLDGLHDSDIRQRAYDRMMAQHASSYGGYKDQSKLLRYYIYKEMAEHAGENTAHKVKSESKPQDAQPDVLTDQDNDGDIDRDDFVEKYGKEGKTGVRGATGKKELEKDKYTEQEIQDAVDLGNYQMGVAKEMDIQLGDTGSRAGVIPQGQVVGKDTKFEGDMAGIDEETYLGDMGGSSAQTAVDAKTNILNQFEQNTDDAGQMIEDKLRSKKKIDQLKMEIKCFHQIYEELIKGFKTKEHQEDYKKVLETNNIEAVRQHHAMMSKMIRAYYKTSSLRLGVIMSAESVFGGQVGNIPSMMGSFGIGMPVQRSTGKNPKLIDRRKGKDRFSNATAGEKQVIRGGVNAKKAVRQAIPRDIDKSAYRSKIDYPDYNIDDAFRPRSYIRKRVYVNPDVKLKVSKH